MSKVDFSEPLFFLNVIGVHPFKTDRFSRIRKCIVLTCYCLEMSFAILEVAFNADGIDTYARASESLVPDCQLMTKLLVLAIYRNKFAQLLKDTKKFWPLHKFGASYQKDFSKYHTFLKIFFQVYKILLAFTCLQFIVTKIIFKKKEPISMKFGESKGLEAPYDQIYLLLDSLIVLITINVVNGFDGLIFYFVGHILSEIQMIRIGFGNYNIETRWNEEKRFMVSSKHHSHVLEFIRKFNDVVSSVLLIQHMSCLFGICFALFLMSKDGLPPDIDRASKYMPYIISFILQTWTFCFSGHLLIDWSSEIPNEIFYSDWDKDYSYKNVLGKVIAMKRGQRAAKLTLGNFGSLDLESFKLVMQKSFSFFTFINAVLVKK